MNDRSTTSAVLFAQLEDAPCESDWTISQAATTLNRSERTIRRMAQTGILKGYKVRYPKGYIWKLKPIALEPNIVTESLAETDSVVENSTPVEAPDATSELFTQDRFDELHEKINRLEIEFLKTQTSHLGLQPIVEADAPTLATYKRIDGNRHGVVTLWNLIKEKFASLLSD